MTQKWSKMTKMAKNHPKQPKMTKNGPKWSEMTKNDQVLAKNGTK